MMPLRERRYASAMPRRAMLLHNDAASPAILLAAAMPYVVLIIVSARGYACCHYCWHIIAMLFLACFFTCCRDNIIVLMLPQDATMPFRAIYRLHFSAITSLCSLYHFRCHCRHPLRQMLTPLRFAIFHFTCHYYRRCHAITPTLLRLPLFSSRLLLAAALLINIIITLPLPRHCRYTLIIAISPLIIITPILIIIIFLLMALLMLISLLLSIFLRFGHYHLISLSFHLVSEVIGHWDTSSLLCANNTNTVISLLWLFSIRHFSIISSSLSLMFIYRLATIHTMLLSFSSIWFITDI